MIEVKQWVYNIHQIFKESTRAWRIALICSLPKSFHHAQYVKFQPRQSTNSMSSTIMAGKNLNMLIKSTPPLVMLSVIRKKQNP